MFDITADGYELSATFQGQFIDGIRTGKGTCRWASGKCYEGEFKDNAQHGYGVLHLEDGSVFTGDFERGEFHGQGKYSFVDGRTYEGEFQNGFMTGEGSFAWPAIDGRPAGSYVGHVYKGEMRGQGKMSFADDLKYIGRFENNVLEGVGQMEIPNARVYQGHFKNGLFHGGGVMKWFHSPAQDVEGRTYRGQFVEGQMCGRGLMIWDEGAKYVGSFWNNEMHGPGKLEHKGKTLIGEFKLGEFTGLGKYINSHNNCVYEGQFVNGVCEGFGRLTLPNLSTWAGQFSNGGLPVGVGLFTTRHGLDSCEIPFPPEFDHLLME